ncbi:MAG: SDR family NAD(P)-dependent oxidoreductase [Anaerolineales bacterium]
MNNKIILITGASSGIGAAAAREFVRQGAQVALVARRADRLAALAEELGPNALAITADVTQRADRERIIAATLEHFGRIDVLFNNAGAARLGWLETLMAEEVETQIQLNLLAVIELTRLVLPHMLARKSGHIINHASMAGLVGTPTYSVYCATKAGVRAFSEALRREVSPFGVHVSVLSPGGVAETEFAEVAGIHRRTRLATPRFLQPKSTDIARAVVGLVRHPQREVIVSWPMRVAAWINATFPALTDWVVTEVFIKRERRIYHEDAKSAK